MLRVNPRPAPPRQSHNVSGSQAVVSSNRRRYPNTQMSMATRHKPTPTRLMKSRHEDDDLHIHRRGNSLVVTRNRQWFLRQLQVMANKYNKDK